MRVLLISATQQEVMPLFDYLKNNYIEIAPNEFKINDIYIKLLVTGPGLVNTTFIMTRELTTSNFDLLLNAGIAGSFTNIPKGSVVSVIADRFGDFGAEEIDGNLIDIFKMGLEDINGFPYHQGWIKLDPVTMPRHLLEVKGISVQTVTGTEHSIKKLVNLYQPDIESMEGAAFAFVAAQFSCKAHQIRSISNQIEPRNKENWDIPLAIKQLNNFLKEYFEDLKEMSL